MEVLSSSCLWDPICKCVRCPFSAICLFMVDKSFFDEFNVFCWITFEFMARFCADYNSCHLIGDFVSAANNSIPCSSLRLPVRGETRINVDDTVWKG